MMTKLEELKLACDKTLYAWVKADYERVKAEDECFKAHDECLKAHDECLKANGAYQTEQNKLTKED